jgi:hypothetical protein
VQPLGRSHSLWLYAACDHSLLLQCPNASIDCLTLTARWGHKPDGVCLVVGGCARGFDPGANTTADVIFTNSDMQTPGAAAAAAGGQAAAAASSSSSSSSSSGTAGQVRAKAQDRQLQYFWEAFPAADGLIGGSPHAISRKAGDWKSDARTTYMFTYMDAQVSCCRCGCLSGPHFKGVRSRRSWLHMPHCLAEALPDVL